MFRSERMRRVTIYALNDERYDVISKLHELGVIQIEDVKNEEMKKSLKSVPGEMLKRVSDHLLKISRLYHIQKLPPMKLSMTQNMFGLDLEKHERVEKKSAEELLKRSQDFLDKHEKKLTEIEDTYSSSLETLDEQKRLKDVIDLFSRYGLSPGLLRDTEHAAVEAGKIQKQLVPKIQKEIMKETDDESEILIRPDTKKESVIVTITLQEHKAKVNFLLKKYNVAGFSIPDMPTEGDVSRWIRDEIKKSENTIKKALSDIAEERKSIFKDTVVLREELEILKERYEIEHKILGSESFFVMQGWVPKSKVLRLKTELREAFEDRVIIRSAFPEHEDRPPVKLTNPGWLGPSEMITELYSLPNYRDLDPTFIVGPVFLVFAGFMLTDFMYGLGLVLLGGFLVLKFGKYSKGLKQLSTNMFWIGIFSMIFGILTGSYFGDLPKYLFGIETAQLAIWNDPLADPLYFLIISLSVAIVHLNIGLVLGTIEDVRKKQWKTMLSDRIIWWLLQLAVAFWYFDLLLPAKIFLGITVLLIIILNGPLGILGMTGFMGDVISYSRLFALALSTAGIAMTVNLLADLLQGVPFVGLFLAILILVVGHLFSFLMNSLGAFVHSIRLQFVEFFGKFYEGGGDGYEPFKEERFYTEVK